MISLEQVKLLESKVAKAIDYVKRVTEENKRLETTLESYQKRIDELEVLIRRFKEDQGKIETGILAALERLNQFEDAIEKSLSPPAVHSAAPQEAVSGTAFSSSAPVEEVLEGPEAEEETDIALDNDEEDLDQGSGEAELDIF